jgi:hypothetical protein
LNFIGGQIKPYHLAAERHQAAAQQGETTALGLDRSFAI